MPKSYNPQDWYWASEDGRVYGSARQTIVEPNDAAFAAWQSDGSVPTPWPKDEAGKESDAEMAAVLKPYGLTLPGGAPIPSGIPDVASAQAKIQLRRAGLRDKVDALIAKADGEVQDWFTDARTWQRENTHVVALGATLELSPAEIDDLFRAAALIDA